MKANGFCLPVSLSLRTEYSTLIGPDHDQLSSAIKTQLTASKAFSRAISNLSLCLYGIGVASIHRKDLLMALASVIHL